MNGPYLQVQARPSYLERVWVSASSVRRLLASGGWGRRPGASTDRAWIESLFGHLKAECGQP